MSRPHDELTWRQLRDELALLAYAGLGIGIPFGAGCYIGWHLARGLVRLMGAGS